MVHCFFQEDLIKVYLQRGGGVSGFFRELLLGWKELGPVTKPLLSEWRAILKGIWWLFLECIPEKKLWVLRSVESCKQGDVTYNPVQYQKQREKG